VEFHIPGIKHAADPDAGSAEVGSAVPVEFSRREDAHRFTVVGLKI
jgi:hypothetical protein